MANYKVTPEELKYKMSLSLQDKIDMTCERIEQWYEHYNGQVYVAFSGGRDSTVLLDLVRNRAFIPDSKLVPAVFSDTGLEYPEIREFVKTIDNVIWIKPKLTYRQVIEKYGFAVVSKEQSKFIREYRNARTEKRKEIILNGDGRKGFKISKKWKFLITAPFKVSDKCCDALKKDPMKTYEKKTGRKAIIGTLAVESIRRKLNYLIYGCNAFDKTNPNSAPLSFWTNQDILNYIEKYNVKYSSIYDMGYDRTGCMFCMFGVQNEKGPKNRFQMMKLTHPKIWNYCIYNLGLGEVLDFIEVPYE